MASRVVRRVLFGVLLPMTVIAMLLLANEIGLWPF